MIQFEVVGETLTTMMQACFAKLPEDKLVEFGQLKTDAQRVSYVLKTDFVHDIVAAEPEDKWSKDEVQAKQFREEGNVLFQKKSYVSAINSYNKCLRYSQIRMQTALTEADEKKDEAKDEAKEANEARGPSEAALAFANRSAALFHLRRYEACLDDVQHALEEGYPEDMQYKLYDRQGKCHANLHEPEEAMNSFNKAMSLLEKAKLAEEARETWVKTLSKQMQACEKINKENKRAKKKQVPLLQGGNRSEVLPNASGLIEMKHNPQAGRYIAAKERVRIGDVVVVEAPYSQVLLPDNYDSHCYHCLQRVSLTHIPDVRLNNIVFCSTACRQTAWKKYFCKEYRFLSLLGEEWCGRIGHLALRTILQMGFPNLFCYMIKADSERGDSDPLTRGFQGDVYSKDIHAVYNMETNITKRLPEGTWDFAVYSVFLLKLLQKMDYFSSCSSKITQDTQCCEELVMTGGALLRLLQVIQCNAVGVVELQFPSNFDDAGPYDVGMGMYTTAALFNHSCDPNAEFIFYGNKLVARATRNIPKEEAINVAYKVTYYKNVIKMRKGYLQSRYCFDCKCEACKQEWRHWRELEGEIPLFKCESCGKALPLGTEMVDKTHIRCTNKKCNNLQDLQATVGKLQLSHDVYAAAMQEAMSGRYEVALPALTDHMLLMQSTILPPFRDLAACQAAITQCYRMEGNTSV